MSSKDWTFQLSSDVTTDPTDPLRWRKQALYVGAKATLDDGSTWECTESDIDELVKNGQERLELGVKHPLPIGHTTNEEANRGWVDRFEKGYDTEGRQSLFLGGRVIDEKAKRTLMANDISIFAPSTDDVAGRKWGRSVKHAAITSYPRIKGLAEFDFDLALSEPGQCLDCRNASLRLAEMEKKVAKLENDEEQQADETETAEDHVRRLRKHGMTSRNILDALVRSNEAALNESLAAIPTPSNRFRSDEHVAMDAAAIELAEANEGSAWLVRDGDHVLVLSEPHDEAYRVVTA